MSGSPQSGPGRRPGGESVALVTLAAAAYIGFAAVMMLDDSGRAQAEARADGPSGAVQVAQATSRPTRPGVGVGEIIPVPGADVDAADVASGPLQFLVKFEGDQAMAWRDRYLADPDECRDAFREFARTHAAFAGLRLARVSYSGVATLEYAGPAPATPEGRLEMTDGIVRRLSAAEGVDYAEPNLIGRTETPQ